MIRNITALTQRELATSFFSPVPYIVAAAFIFATTALFMKYTLVEGGEASMHFLLESMAKLLIMALPLLTMRTLADEFASGTVETLMTAPVTDVEVVLGKFFGVLSFYVALLAMTILHVVLLYIHGAQDLSVTAYGYLGILLLGSLYIAIGVFASSLTKHQLLAAIIAMGILAAFTVLIDFLASWLSGYWRAILSQINVLHHYEDFSRGIFDTKTLIFFVSGTLFFLFLAVKVLESRRWR